FGTARMAHAWYAETRPNAKTLQSIEEALEWLAIPEGTDLRNGGPLVIGD
ncbi:MAG: hypothetical protein HUJ31_17695, partial [Pseudomonadales bacterium]|nr:hypothetical protein [Pseudomonadales bacterium]